MIRFYQLVLALCVIALGYGAWTLAVETGYEAGQRDGRADDHRDLVQCRRALVDADDATGAAAHGSEQKLIEAAKLVQQLADEAKHAEEALAICRASTQSICRSNPASSLIPPATIARARDPPVAARVWD